jgi:hypothetical protein
VLSVIFVAISNLINLSDIWKEDMETTFKERYDTSIGLAVGIGCSCLMFLIVDLILSANREPHLFESSYHTSGGMSTDQVLVVRVRLESDILLSRLKIL